MEAYRYKVKNHCLGKYIPLQDLDCRKSPTSDNIGNKAGGG
jgi:hypothetical protein